METKRINTGGGNYVIQINDNNRVLIIGEGYITVWETEQDFYDNLDDVSENIPLDIFEY